MLLVPTEREKVWIPDEVRLKRAEFVDAVYGLFLPLYDIIISIYVSLIYLHHYNFGNRVTVIVVVLST